MSRRTTRPAIPLVRCLPAMAALGLAFAAVPAVAQTGTTTLYGCYVPNSGTVYRIRGPGLPDDCRGASHVEFSWSAQGPQGPAGPPGPQGATGPQGPAGGLAGLEVTSTTAPVPARSTRAIDAVCEVGKVAISGGFRTLTGIFVTASHPRGDAGDAVAIGRIWRVVFFNPEPADEPGTAIAICAVAQ